MEHTVGAYRWSSGPHDHKIIAGKVKYQHDTIPETSFFCNTKVCCFFPTGVAGISVADCVYRHWKQLLYSFSIVAVNHSRSNESQEVFLCFIWCSRCDYIRVNTTNLTVTVAFFGLCPLICQRLLKYVCALKLTMLQTGPNTAVDPEWFFSTSMLAINTFTKYCKHEGRCYYFNKLFKSISVYIYLQNIEAFLFVVIKKKM